ncbi:hypothetical protein C0991_010654 [Blastosporella zonata]|nr:hypothetical protein C0991_010654 [Blastosporella zonata]
MSRNVPRAFSPRQSGFSTELLWLVRDLNEFEVEGTFVAYHHLERIWKWSMSRRRPPRVCVPLAYWPASGDLRVENLLASYAPDGVLRNLSFHIKSGERIGIELFDALASSPELLSGTLGRNIDPFEQDDATLNDALRAAGMTSLQNGTNAEGKLTLDSFISGAGDNLSIGQRQILALARAISFFEGKWTVL